LASGVYTNSYFGFSFSIPEGWIVTEKTITDQLASKIQAKAPGAKRIGANAEILLQVSQGKASGILIFMSISLPPSSKSLSPRDLLSDMDARLKKGDSIAYTRTSDFQDIMLGGRSFLMASYSGAKRVGIISVEFRQEYFVAVSEGHYLQIILTGSDDEVAQVRSALSALKFR
jgi:hypothetical protein